MPLVIPSLLERSRAVYDSIRARLPGGAAEVWPNNLRIIGKVVAMAAHECDLRAEILFEQIFTSTAQGAYLDLHAYEVGLSRKPPAPASGVLIVAAASGLVVPAGQRFFRSDGVFVASIRAVGESGGSVSIPVEAEEAGAAGNTPPGATFAAAVPLAGLAEEGQADGGGLGGGVDAEPDAALRARILYRKRNRPRGGAATDYIEWATDVPGIVEAHAKGFSPGSGAVSVWPLLAGSGAERIPTRTDCQRVAAYLEDRRPVAAMVLVHQAVARPINVVVNGLVPDAVSVRAEIQAELLDLFDARATVALPNENAIFSRSWIAEAVSAAAGEDRHVLTTPAADIVLAAGQFPVLGTVVIP